MRKAWEAFVEVYGLQTLVTISCALVVGLVGLLLYGAIYVVLKAVNG